MKFIKSLLITLSCFFISDLLADDVGTTLSYSRLGDNPLIINFYPQRDAPIDLLDKVNNPEVRVYTPGGMDLYRCLVDQRKATRVYLKKNYPKAKKIQGALPDSLFDLDKKNYVEISSGPAQLDYILNCYKVGKGTSDYLWLGASHIEGDIIKTVMVIGFLFKDLEFNFYKLPEGPIILSLRLPSSGEALMNFGLRYDYCKDVVSYKIDLLNPKRVIHCTCMHLDYNLDQLSLADRR